MMEANPHHYSLKAVKTAKHGLSLKGKMPIGIDRVIHEKTETIKNSLWLPEEEKEQRRDIEKLRAMKKEWAKYFAKSTSDFHTMTKPADLNKLIVKLQQNSGQSYFFEPRLAKLLEAAKQKLSVVEA